MDHITYTIILLIIIFTKSAQFLLFVWLTIVTIAPTSVSSLVHLLNIKHKNLTLLISIIILISGLIANFEVDF